MKHDNREPCESCPYRRDAPRELWDRYEFENLLTHDADPIYGRQFGCHKGQKLALEDRQPCIGWLLDQDRRGLPSIRLRMTLATDDAAVEQLKWLQENPCKHDLFDSIEEMCEANGVKL